MEVLDRDEIINKWGSKFEVIHILCERFKQLEAGKPKVIETKKTDFMDVAIEEFMQDALKIEVIEKKQNE